jgi:hypothetical protein
MTNPPAGPDAGPGPDPTDAGSASPSEQMTRDLVDDVAAYEVDPPPPARATRPSEG